jgi:hypothetical protein
MMLLKNCSFGNKHSTNQSMSISVCVFINHNCSCGGYLHPRKVCQLPSQYGPGPIAKVMREVAQACIDCALQEKQVYNMMREGSGKVIVTGKY